MKEKIGIVVIALIVVSYALFWYLVGPLLDGYGAARRKIKHG